MIKFISCTFCFATGVLAYCPAGLMPPDCMRQCAPGKYGINCASYCPATCTNRSCRSDSGSCYRCLAGFTGSRCSLMCRKGFFGQDCKNICPQNCMDSLCNPFTGYCESCLKGYRGAKCENFDTFLNSSQHLTISTRSVYDQIMNTGTGGIVMISIIMFLFIFTLPISALVLCSYLSNKNLQKNRYIYERLHKQRQIRLNRDSSLSSSAFLFSKYRNMEKNDEDIDLHINDDKEKKLKLHSKTFSKRDIVKAVNANTVRHSAALQKSHVKLRTDIEVLSLIHKNKKENSTDHPNKNSDMEEDADSVGQRVSEIQLQPQDKALKPDPSEQISDLGSNDLKIDTGERNINLKLTEASASNVTHQSLESSCVVSIAPGLQTHSRTAETFLETSLTLDRNSNLTENTDASSCLVPDNGGSGTIFYGQEKELQSIQKERCQEIDENETKKVQLFYQAARSNSLGSDHLHMTRENNVINTDMMPTAVNGNGLSLASSESVKEEEINTSTMRHFFETLKVKRTLAETMKSLEPYMYAYRQSEHSGCGDIAINVNLIAGPLDNVVPVQLIQDPCWLENIVDVHHHEDIATRAACNDPNPVVSDNGYLMDLTEEPQKDYPVSVVDETIHGSFNPDPVPIPVPLSGNASITDIGRYIIDISTGEWQQLQTFEYEQLNFKTSAACGMLPELSSGDFSSHNVNEVSCQRQKVCNLDCESNCENSPLLLINDDTYLKKSLPVNGTSNNTKNVHDPIPENLYPYELCPNSYKNLDMAVTHQNSLRSGQRYLPFSNNFRNQHPIPLFNITNSAPTSLCINYGLCDDSLRKLPFIHNPGACFDPSTVYNAESNNKTNSKGPVQTNLTSSSPPRANQTSQTSIGTTISSSYDSPHRNVRKQMAHQMGNRFAIRSDKGTQNLQNKSHRRHCRQLRGQTSPAKFYFPHRPNLSSSHAFEATWNSANAGGKIHKPLHFSRQQNYESQEGNSSSTLSYLPVWQVRDENPLGGNVCCEIGDNIALIPKSVINMTVMKTPSKGVKTIWTNGRGKEMLANDSHESSQEVANNTISMGHQHQGREIYCNEKSDRPAEKQGHSLPQNGGLLRRLEAKRYGMNRLTKPSVHDSSKPAGYLTKTEHKTTRRTTFSSLGNASSSEEVRLYQGREFIKNSDRSSVESYTRTVSAKTQSGSSIQVYKKTHPIDKKHSTKLRDEHPVKSGNFIKDNGLNIIHTTGTFAKDRGLNIIYTTGRKDKQGDREEKKTVQRKALNLQIEKAIPCHDSSTEVLPSWNLGAPIMKDGCTQFITTDCDGQYGKIIVPEQDYQLKQFSNAPLVGIYPLPSLLEEFLLRENATTVQEVKRTMGKIIPIHHRKITASPSFPKVHETMMSWENGESTETGKLVREHQQMQETRSKFIPGNNKIRGILATTNDYPRQNQAIEGNENGDLENIRLCSRCKNDYCKSRSRNTDDLSRLQWQGFGELASDKAIHQNTLGTQWDSVGDDDCEQFYDALESIDSNPSLIPRSSLCRLGSNEKQNQVPNDNKHEVNFASQPMTRTDDDLHGNNEAVKMKLNVSKDMKTQKLVCDLKGSVKSERLIAFRFAPHCRKQTPNNISLDESRKRKRLFKDKPAILPDNRTSKIVRRPTKIRWAIDETEVHERSSADLYHSTDPISVGGSTEEKDSTIFNSLPSGTESISGDQYYSTVTEFGSFKDCS